MPRKCPEIHCRRGNIPVPVPDSTVTMVCPDNQWGVVPLTNRIQLFVWNNLRALFPQ